MESPGYIGASYVFDAYGARVSGLRVDDEGMEVPHSWLGDVRLAYVTPGHQFPLRVMIIEDDYDSEYRYSGRPLPALQGLDRFLRCASGTS